MINIKYTITRLDPISIDFPTDRPLMTHNYDRKVKHSAGIIAEWIGILCLYGAHVKSLQSKP